MSVRIVVGDCRAVLKTLPDESVHCVVTSPPYWGLRDYGVDGQLGLEASFADCVAEMVAVFREVRRVLRADGTLWLNLGDSYAGGGGFCPDAPSSAVSKSGKYGNTGALIKGNIRPDNGLKPKDLCGIPWRVAFALQQPYYTGRIKNEADRVWLAAMIDGEGCMFIHRRKAGASAYSYFKKRDGTEVEYKRTQDSYGVGLEVSNTNEAIVRRCMEITGQGSICSQGPDQNARRKQLIFRWNMRTNECRDIIREVYPYLVAKKQQARLVLGCPSSGEKAAAAHQALIGLHNGISTDLDFPEPESMYEPGWYLRSDVIWSKKKSNAGIGNGQADKGA